MSTRLVLILSSCVAIALCSPPALAQSFTGTILGSVRDSSGGGVQNAAITVTNTATNARTKRSSDADGNYTAPLLPPGEYMLEVESTGFKKAVRRGIVLQVQQQAQIDIVLEVGAITESISVTSNAPLLEATTSSLGKVVENRRIMSLPLNTRNVYSLIFLTPGTSGSVGNDYGGVGYQVNGSSNKDILIDGVTATQPTVNGAVGISVFPSVDAIGEFKLQSANYSAEFGRSAGSVLNVVYKSGTNTIHGSAYEFLRNSVLDANNFFANRQGQDLASFKRSQFGSTISGPIKQDRTFYMFSYEGLRQRSFGSTTTSVPTEEERTGDFSKSLAQNGELIRIFNPFSTRPNPNGSGFIRDMFPNNTIPAAMIDPVGRNVIQYYPHGNTAGHPVTRRNNFYKTGSGALNTDNIDIRVDHNITQNQRFFARYSHRTVTDNPPIYFPEEIRIAEGRINTENRGRQVVAEYNNTLSANTILTARVGFSRAAFVYDNQGLGFLPSKLGLPTSIDSAVDRQMFPGFSASGYASLGGGDHRFNPFMTYSTNASITKVHGSHSLKFGFEGRMIRVNVWEARSAGSFNFSAAFTQGPNPNTASTTAGNGLASLLLGTGTGNLIQAWKNVASQSFYYAGYIQDDWRITRKLTLNLGLRYDLDGPRTERYNRMNYFDPSARSPLADKVPGYPNLTGGVVFVGVNGNSRRQQDYDINDWGPRIGLAYQLDNDTVIRAAYGHFFGTSLRAAQGTVGPFGFRTENQWIGSLDGITPYNLLSNPYPQGFRPPPGASEGLLTQTGSNLEVVFRNQTLTPWSQQWNLTIQRSLPGQTMVEAAYVGNRGLQLSRGGEGTLNMNQLPPEYMALGSKLNELVPNPFYEAIGRGIYVSPTVSRAQLLRPYPQFTNITPLFTSGASSSYHSLQATVTKRFSHGFQFDAAYTWSKLISTGGSPQNYYDVSTSRAPSGNPQRLVLSYLYDLPFGRGRAIGANASGPVNWIISGWQVNGITSFISGSYLSVSASNTAGLFGTNTWANNNGKSAKLSGPVHERLERYFDTSVLTQPPAFTFGNVNTLPDVLSDSTRNFDVSIFREFPALERMRVQFRAEFLNAFNTPRFGNPTTGVTSNTFGAITSQGNAPRQVQFGLKLLW